MGEICVQVKVAVVTADKKLLVVFWVAVMVAVPALTGISCPLSDIDATDKSELVKVHVPSELLPGGVKSNCGY